MKKILLVASTAYELAPIIEWMESSGRKEGFNRYIIGESDISILITGVGMLSCMFGLCRYPKMDEIDLLIQLGVGGSLDKNLALGSVVEISADRNADLGVQLADGGFSSVFDLGLKEKDFYPLKDGWVQNEYSSGMNLQAVKGITVNTVTGTDSRERQLRDIYPNAVVESMEGFAFLYYLSMMHLDGFQWRAISNYVEKRNKDNWKIDAALNQLKTAFISYLNI